MVYKLRTNKTITLETPVRGEGGLIKKLRSYYTDEYPMIIRRHAFITCQQLRGETFTTWWERKMRKAQECAFTTMTLDNWLELEVLLGINDQNLRKRLLQEKDPARHRSPQKTWPSSSSTTKQTTTKSCENKNHTKGKPTNHRPKMYNVKDGHPFKFDVYPDTGCIERIIANNVTQYQRMSIYPHVREPSQITFAFRGG